jgi:LacI family transcriptional regulator
MVLSMNIYDISEKSWSFDRDRIARAQQQRTCQPENEGKVLAVMAEYDYASNPFARRLGLKTMRTIGLLCPNAADYYLANALSFLERMMRMQGYDSMLLCAGEKLADREKGVEWLIGKHADGIILISSTFEEDTEEDNQYLRSESKHL